MATNSTPSPSPPEPRRGFGHVIWTWLAVAALTICLYSPVHEVANPQLDPSNYASYAHFASLEFQYGPDVVPMAGPYGFVPYGFLYAGKLFWKRLPLELLTKAVLAALMVWFLRRPSGHLVWRGLWLAAFLLLTPLLKDLPYDLAVLFAGLCLIEHHLRADRRGLMVSCGLAAYLALLTLFKGTQTSLAVATLGLLAVQAFLARDFRRLPWIAGTYVATLVVLLLAAGQNPLNFPLYLRGVWELSSGYNAAMGLDEPPFAFLTGVGALLAVGALILVLLIARRGPPIAWVTGLLLAGFTFVEWKHGFVRADGHVFFFYHFAAIAAPTIMILADRAGRPALPAWRWWVALPLAATAMILGVIGDGGAVWARRTWEVRQLGDHVRQAAGQLAAPARAKTALDAELAEQRHRADLPLVRETIGAGSIDFFGTEFGYLLLNRFNYRPRPMGGGTFNVFTAWLQERNAAYVANPATRPAYFLLGPETIDQRFLAQDDPGTLRGLLDYYRPVASEQGYVLLQAVAPAAPAVAPRPLATQPVVLGQPVTPPAVAADEMLLVSFTLPLNLAGRARAALYKPPLLFMSLEGDGIAHAENRRVVPGLFRTPVPLDPVLETADDFLALYAGERGKPVRQFTLHSAQPGWWAAGLEAHFYAAPRPAPQPVVAARLRRLLPFPVANVPPLAVVPPNAPPRRFDGVPVQMMEAGTRISFALTTGHNEFRFKFGQDAESYLRGKTDGVEFMVDLERPGLPVETIYRRWLRPKIAPGDRVLQSQRIILPPHPEGTKLTLHAGPGPDGDGGWDWGYVTNIRLLGDGYIPEQFAGFNRAPVELSASTAGTLPVNGRDLFMFNPPGSLVFPLTGSERELSFAAGLLPGAYTQGGNSDGVEFVAELRAPGGAVTRLASHRINPRDNHSQRDDQAFTVPLPSAPAGTQLILRVTPGPHGDGAWDWSYLSSLVIR